MRRNQAAVKPTGNLPEIEEIAEELQIMVAIRKGRADVKAGRVKLHAQVEKLFEKLVQI